MIDELSSAPPAGESLDTFSERELLGLDDPTPLTIRGQTAPFPKVVHWIVDSRRTADDFKAYLSKIGVRAGAILAPYYEKPVTRGALREAQKGAVQQKTELTLLKALAARSAGVTRAEDSIQILGHPGSIRISENAGHLDTELLASALAVIDSARDSFYIRHRTEFGKLNALFEEIRRLSGGALTPENIFRNGHVPPYRERRYLKQGRELSLEQILHVVLTVVSPPTPKTPPEVQKKLDEKNETRSYQFRELLARKKILSRHTLQILHDNYIAGSGFLEQRKKKFGDNW